MATRELTFLLAKPERRLLCALAARLPAAVQPNHLTVLGVVGALGAGAAYAASALDARWLWVASAALALNWAGDSLDGTLARVRKIERPRYGYYLDHLVDAFSTGVVGVGLGLSPFVDLWLALGLVVVYLVLSINVYLESAVFGIFELGYGRIGPTEVRILLIAANALLAVAPNGLPGLPVPLPALTNAALVAALVGMLGLLVGRFAKNLATLARLEPSARRSAGIQ